MEYLAPQLQENGFGIEIELTIKLDAIASGRFCEIPIRYSPRSRLLGEKIRWVDGFWALCCIVRYGVLHKIGKRWVFLHKGT